MTNLEFYEDVKTRVMECLQEAPEDEVRVRLIHSLRHNDSSEYGLSIFRKGQPVTASISLDRFYEMYINGIEMDEILQLIANTYRRAEEQKPSSKDVKLEYESIRNDLIFEIVDKEKNSKRLKQIPYVDVDSDFAMIFSTVFTDEDSMMGRIVITNDLVENYGYDMEKLRKDAVANTMTAYPAIMRDMDSVIDGIKCEMSLDEIYSVSGSEGKVLNFRGNPDEKMYLLTNCNGFLGAGVLLYPGLKEEIAEYLGKNYYILPSSVHELIVVPEGDDIEPGNLLDMVRDVNNTKLSERDLLSYKIWYYDSDSHALTVIAADLADEYAN